MIPDHSYYIIKQKHKSFEAFRLNVQSEYLVSNMFFIIIYIGICIGLFVHILSLAVLWYPIFFIIGISIIYLFYIIFYFNLYIKNITIQLYNFDSSLEPILLKYKILNILNIINYIFTMIVIIQYNLYIIFVFVYTSCRYARDLDINIARLIINIYNVMLYVTCVLFGLLFIFSIVNFVFFCLWRKIDPLNTLEQKQIDDKTSSIEKHTTQN